METMITKCQNCSSGMEWNFHHTICTGEPEPPEADFWRGKCSDCGFTATVEEGHEPDSTIGKWQVNNQLFAFRERKNQVKKQRKTRRTPSNSAPMSEGEAKEALGW